MIRPESQITPVEAKASGTRPQAATDGPNARHVSRNVAATSPTKATVPPLTSVIGLAPQASAWGHESNTGRVPMCGVPG